MFLCVLLYSQIHRVFTTWVSEIYVLQVKNSNRRTDSDTANSFEQRGTCAGTGEENRRVL